jgi:hypothetical protein
MKLLSPMAKLEEDLKELQEPDEELTILGLVRAGTEVLIACPVPGLRFEVTVRVKGFGKVEVWTGLPMDRLWVMDILTPCLAPPSSILPAQDA